MRRRTLAVDVGIAALLAALVLIIAPGLAIAAILAILVVLVCAISFAVDARARRRRPPRAQTRRVQ